MQVVKFRTMKIIKTHSQDVAVIGNIGIDTNIYLQNQEIDFSVESNFTNNFDYIGQAGGFTCRGFAKLGFMTAFIGYVGDDFMGKYIKEELIKDGIDISCIFTDPGGTSRSINFVYPDGRRKNFYDGKNHMMISPDTEQITKLLSKTKLAHFHIPNWARNLLPIAKESGVIISCDIQDMLAHTDPYRQDFFNYSDILFLSGANIQQPNEVVTKFLSKNPERIIIVGLAANGCLLGTSQGINHYPAVQLPKDVIDTNGAGDGLAVGFLSSYIFDGYSIDDAVLRAQITARYTCTIKASTTDLISRELLDDYFIKITHNQQQ